MSQITSLTSRWKLYADDLAKHRTVLVVDDDVGLRTLFSEVLRNGALRVEEAGDGAEALAKFEAQEFAAVLLDKNLPDVDGLELLTKFQEKDPDCEAVIVTGYGNLASVITALDLRAVDYLTKPITDVALLVASVERGLARRQRRLLARQMWKDLSTEVGLRARLEDGDLLQDVYVQLEKRRRRLSKQRTVLFCQRDVPRLKDLLEELRAGEFEILMVDTARDAVERCREYPVNAVVVSERFGDATPSEMLEFLKGVDNYPEVVMLATTEDPVPAIRALERGAAAYLLLPLDDVSAARRRMVRACRDHHERLYAADLKVAFRDLLQKLKDRTFVEPQPAIEMLLRSLAPRPK